MNLQEGSFGTDGPLIIENRQFVEYEEEDIQRLNEIEERKFVENPRVQQVKRAVEAELGRAGHWEKHWLTIDPSGRRVYAHIYFGDDRALAVTADGEIIKEISYR
ncbi:MAG: hypothetical protein GX073_02375 [Firmicutes bacterium]|nr:hypothetical protein [Bacillota bacterium]